MFLWDKSYNLKGFWYYVLGSFILILFSTIGQIPLLFFIDYDSVGLDTTSVDLLNTIPSNLRLFLIMISFVAVLPAIWLVVRKLHDLPIMSILSGRKSIDYKRILFSFCLWGSIVSLMVIAGYFISPDNYEINLETGLYFGKKNSYIENKNIFISGMTQNENQNIKWELIKIS